MVDFEGAVGFDDSESPVDGSGNVVCMFKTGCGYFALSRKLNQLLLLELEVKQAI